MKKGIDYTGIVVVTLCHDGAGQYLLQLRSKNCRDEHLVWDSGGGALEFGETLHEALVRETLEEYGILPISEEFLGVREVFREVNGVKSHWLAFDYRVLVDRNSVRIGEPDMCDQIGWFALSEFPTALHSQFPKFLNNYKDRI